VRVCIAFLFLIAFSSIFCRFLLASYCFSIDFPSFPHLFPNATSSLPHCHPATILSPHRFCIAYPSLSHCFPIVSSSVSSTFSSPPRPYFRRYLIDFFLIALAMLCLLFFVACLSSSIFVSRRFQFYVEYASHHILIASSSLLYRFLIGIASLSLSCRRRITSARFPFSHHFPLVSRLHTACLLLISYLCYPLRFLLTQLHSFSAARCCFLLLAVSSITVFVFLL
jgi:hypothetical protein